MTVIGTQNRPLQGIKVVEMAGIGPGPFCGMMLADMGAEVVRVDRTDRPPKSESPSTDRGKQTLRLNLKDSEAIALLLDLVAEADVLIEGFRPGVMERLGLGPDICLTRNPRLVYGRMTGWGQTGPLASSAGHDLNYIALTGVLNATGYADRPPSPPLHLVGDLAGGAMMLAYGIVCALYEARSSGAGQVIDAAICDGVAALSTSYHDPAATWVPQRQANYLDGGAPFYACYTCSDGKYISIGAIEPQFYALLLKLCGVDDPQFAQQWNRSDWAALRVKLAHLFLTKSRDEWTELLEGTDACFAPVLDFGEAQQHPHLQARGIYQTQQGRTLPAPAPRLSRTPARAGDLLGRAGFADELLLRMGRTNEQIADLRANGTLA